MTMKRFGNVMLRPTRIMAVEWVEGDNDEACVHIIMEGGKTITLQGGERLSEEDAKAYDEFKRWFMACW